MRLALVLVVVLNGCAREPDVVDVTPSLACKERVKCHIYSWSIGVRYGPNISGTHIECKCMED